MEKDALIELVKKSKNGDMEAMEKLLLHAHTSVSYQCRKMLPSQQDAEDMTQEILLTIYEKLDTLEEPAAFHKWLHNITARRCMNAISRTHVEYQFAEDEEGHSILDTLEEMDEQKVPDKWLDNQETARMIDEIVNDLPEVQRLCTLMFYYSELSVKEMANIMKVSENTVKSRLNYARKAIKEKVLDYEKKGIKLYGISPIPFLFFFLHRSKDENNDPAAARTMVDNIVSRSSASSASTSGMASAGAGSASTGTAASVGAASGGPVVSAGAAAAGTAVTAAAAATTSGGFLAAVFGVIPVKVIAGVAAAAVAVGGITAVTTVGKRQPAETPAAVTVQAEKEQIPQQEDPLIIPEETVAASVTEAAEETTATVPRETAALPNYDDPTDSEENTPSSPETTRPTEPEDDTPSVPDNTDPTEPGDDTPSEPDNTDPTDPGEGDDDPENHTHDYSRSVTREASCCSNGTATYTCLCGDAYTEAIPKTEDHTFELRNWSSGDGYVLVCTNTGIVKQVDNDHSHHYLATVQDPTCTEGGYTVYTCKENTLFNGPCTDSFTMNETEALGHNYRSQVVAPTYTDQGYTEHTCNRCGDSYRDNYTDTTGTPLLNNSTVKSLITDEVTSVVFTDIPAPDGETTDVSAAQDGSVVAWQKDTTLYVASMDGSPISAGEDFSGMFQDRISLTSVDLTNLDTGNVTDMSYLFCGCSSLMSVNLGNLDTGKVTQMDLMFYECSSLSSLDLSSFDTGSVTDMSYMFAGCRSLTILDIRNFNTGSVSSMAGMFAECGSLMSLDVSSFDTGNVTDMGNMFSFCGMLTSLDLRPFDISNVRYMNDMFRECNSLAAIYAGDWTNAAVNVTDSTDMFLSCFCLFGATNYDSDRTDLSMANPISGYFTGDGSSGDHVHEDVVTVTPPTCTEAGYTTYACACGHTFITDETEPLGHSYESTVVDSTETESGYTEYTCTVCGDTYRDTGSGSEDEERCICGAEISEGACTGCWLEAGGCLCEVQQEEMPFAETPEEDDPAEEMTEVETSEEEIPEEEPSEEETPEEENPLEEDLLDGETNLPETT